MSDGVGVILYGPPAAGKDTIGQALAAIDTRYRHYQRLKVGIGRIAGYRWTTVDELGAMRARGELVWENSAYGSTYAVDEPSLCAALDDGVPVVHLGQVAAVEAVICTLPGSAWVVVDLWCSREVAAARLVGRGSADVAERLRVWDATPHLTSPDLAIDTSAVEPGEVAQRIHAATMRQAGE